MVGAKDQTQPFQAVMFDMDGVIVDSQIYWHKIKRDHILPAVIEGELPAPEETTGMNYKKTYDYLNANYTVTTDREKYLSLYNEAAVDIYKQHAALMNGFRDLCSAIREANYANAVVSSADAEWIEWVVDRFDLKFDHKVSATAAPCRGKPNADIYEYAAGLFDLEPGSCIAIEDSEHGIQAASDAGATVIGYRGEANDDLELETADAVVSGPDDLRATLSRRLDIDITC